MIWILIACHCLLGLVGLSHCTTGIRFDASIRLCGWFPNREANSRAYSEFETGLTRANIPKEDVDGLFTFTGRQKKYWEKRALLSRKADATVVALTLLETANELDHRDCFDHCTFVLAKDNCNSAMHLQACSPRSNNQHYIKAMLDSKVFSLIERCQIPLIHRALSQNESSVEPYLYELVEFITNLMTHMEPTNPWNSIDEMALNYDKLFFAARRMTRPAQAGFFDNIGVIMLDVERRLGLNQLITALNDGTLQWTDAKAQFDTLIVRPCLTFINKMHSVMDATIFYGRIFDSKQSRFTLQGDLPYDVKIRYFKLLRMFEACQYLDNAVYYVDWKGKARQMLLRYHQFSSPQLTEWRASSSH